MLGAVAAARHGRLAAEGPLAGRSALLADVLAGPGRAGRFPDAAGQARDVVGRCARVTEGDGLPGPGALERQAARGGVLTTPRSQRQVLTGHAQR